MSTPNAPTGSSRIRLLLVDDHKVVRLGLRAVLSDAPHLEIVAEADTASAAVEAAARSAPDVILMDARLPDQNGFAACRRIKDARPETKVIILTSYADDSFVLEAIDAGADGYLLKKADSSDLISSIEKVASGGVILDPGVARKVLGYVKAEAKTASGDRLTELSPREIQILELVARGQTNKEIAEDLHLSEGTTRNYLSAIFGKLGVSRRAQAATAYLRWSTNRGRHHR